MEDKKTQHYMNRAVFPDLDWTVVHVVIHRGMKGKGGWTGGWVHWLKARYDRVMWKKKKKTEHHQAKNILVICLQWIHLIFHF